jgi:hypothetical protein
MGKSSATLRMAFGEPIWPTCRNAGPFVRKCPIPSQYSPVLTIRAINRSICLAGVLVSFRFCHAVAHTMLSKYESRVAHVVAQLAAQNLDEGAQDL